MFIGIKNIFLYSKYIKDLLKFRRKVSVSKSDRTVNLKDLYPCLLDNTENTTFDSHYIYHPAWAARILRKIMPSKHIDISSTLHFSSIISAFINVEFYDYRPAKLNLDGFISKRGDLMSLPFDDCSVESLSCMHVVEHIGLGRYGDPLDPLGDIKAIAELKRVLANNGNLIFVTPIGNPRIMFNAHRIYSYKQIIEYFSELELVEFSLIPDSAATNGIIINADENVADEQKYGCGCFWFRKTRN